MEAVRLVFLAAMGFSGGVVISGAVFVFLAIIGIVPRLAQKTKTQMHISKYESAMMLGGLFGTLTLMWDFSVPVGPVIAAALSLCIGIFIGCLAISLAETLKAMPIMVKRGKMQNAIFFFVLAIALGKLGGSVVQSVWFS